MAKVIIQPTNVLRGMRHIRKIQGMVLMTLLFEDPVMELATFEAEVAIFCPGTIGTPMSMDIPKCDSTIGIWEDINVDLLVVCAWEILFHILPTIPIHIHKAVQNSVYGWMGNESVDQYAGSSGPTW